MKDVWQQLEDLRKEHAELGARYRKLLRLYDLLAVEVQSLRRELNSKQAREASNEA